MSDQDIRVTQDDINAFVQKYQEWAQSLSPVEQAAGMLLFKQLTEAEEGDVAGYSWDLTQANHGTVGSHSGGWGVVGHVGVIPDIGAYNPSHHHPAPQPKPWWQLW